MQRYKIVHRTYYNYTDPVTLNPHSLRLRPKEGHELRIESSRLQIRPTALLRWHRDVEDNSVAIATFDGPTAQLAIESELIIQQYNDFPLDFVVADYAVFYPLTYKPEDRAVLSPHLNVVEYASSKLVEDWLKQLWDPAERIETYALMLRLAQRIQQSLIYQRREEPGVQTPAETLSRATGSCRDYAYLFMEATRHLGLAARFVSGYLHAPPTDSDFGATHAWAEVFLPGAGWTGFDPSIGSLVGSDHIAVAVAKLPESVPPVAGSFIGAAQSTLDVGVWVSEL